MTQPSQLPQTPLQHWIVQLALELATELEAQSHQAQPGSVLDNCETLLLDRGRQFLRDALATTLQHRADEADKKGASRGPAPADRPGTTRATTTPTRSSAVTAASHATPSR
jgi:hypothetical protein